MPNLNVLWTWKSDPMACKTVSCLTWKPDSVDLLAVGYGDLSFTPRSLPGRVAFWSPKHLEQPQWSFETAHGVTALAFSRCQPNVLAIGLYDGNIVIYDLHSKSANQALHSGSSGGRHSDPVWQLVWKSVGDGEEALLSVSGDGRVVQWSVNKGLESTDLMKLRRSTRKKSHDATHQGRAPFINRLSRGMCLALSPTDSSTYLVGTEEGYLHKCSASYSEQYIETYVGHLGPVYTVQWSPFRPDLFLSCGADWTLQMWLSDRSTPILTFQTGRDEINDLQWCPYHSTVFACATAGGKVEIWDISISTLKPIAYQTYPGCQLTHLIFHQKSHVLICGDNKGGLTVLQLTNIIPTVTTDAKELNRVLAANMRQP